MEKIKISRAILVEGKYDKILLERIFDADIFTTGGFSIFSSAEKTALLSRIAEKQGLIVFTDSDPAGFVIRNKLKGMLPKDRVVNIYAPQLDGKEKRKSKPSKAGILGVEGIECDLIIRLFERAGVIGEEKCGENLSERRAYAKADLYAHGLCGTDGSSEKRNEFCRKNGLPCGMTPNALLEAVNILGISLEK